MEKLLAYLNSLSRESRNQFVAACATTEGYLRKACSVGDQLNPKLCVLIEVESANVVTRPDLRPDDWQAIWPELAGEPA